MTRRLLLDKRFTLKERYAYTTALEAGHFAACLAIVRAKMTPEQIENANRRAEKIRAVFCPEEEP